QRKGCRVVCRSCTSAPTGIKELFACFRSPLLIRGYLLAAATTSARFKLGGRLIVALIQILRSFTAPAREREAIENLHRHRNLPIIDRCQSAEQRQGGLSAAVLGPPMFGERAMITRAERLLIFEECVPERKCPLCSHLPRAERPQFRADLDCIPIRGTCFRCFLAFVKNITGCEPPTKH